MPDDEIWPKDAKQVDHKKLLDFIAERADEKTKKEIVKLETETTQAEAIANSNGDLAELQDMPDTVLDGRLGELCERCLLAGKRFPLAYAWPALIASASVLAPRYTQKQRLNLFVALVGPVHSGKSLAIEAAQQLLVVEPPVLLNLMAGSAEGLTRKCKDANGEPRLFSPH